MINLFATTVMGNILKMSVLIAFFFVFNPNSQAQLTTFSNQDKIIDFLGNTRFNDLLTSNPSYLAFLDARCSSGYKIVDMSKEKAAEFELIEKIAKNNTIDSDVEAVTAEEFIQLSSQLDFNFLQYSFQFDRTIMTYYKLGNTGKVLMIYPVEYINKLIISNTSNND